jgi:hypothetical protein
LLLGGKFKNIGIIILVPSTLGLGVRLVVPSGSSAEMDQDRAKVVFRIPIAAGSQVGLCDLQGKVDRGRDLSSLLRSLREIK